jgi:hypothetical protein
MGVLQLEIQSGNKRRILYVDPKHVSNHDLKVKKQAINRHKVFHHASEMIPMRDIMLVYHSLQTEKIISVVNISHCSQL